MISSCLLGEKLGKEVQADPPQSFRVVASGKDLSRCFLGKGAG